MNTEKKQKLEDLRRVRLADTFVYPVAVVGCTGNLLFSRMAAKLLGLGRNCYVQFHNDYPPSKDDIITVGEHPRPGWPVCWFRHWLKKIFYLPLEDFYKIVKELAYEDGCYILSVDETDKIYGGKRGFKLTRIGCVPNDRIEHFISSSTKDMKKRHPLYSTHDREKILSILSSE